jgi:hypothetical protein
MHTRYKKKKDADDNKMRHEKDRGGNGWLLGRKEGRKHP